MQPAPAAPLRIEILPDAGATAGYAAAWIAERIVRTLATKARFVLAVSGGSTPRPLFEELARKSIPWRRVHVVQVDERIVPIDSQERNFKMLQEHFVNLVPIPSAQIHPLPVDLPDCTAGAREYATLLATLTAPTGAIDLVQLGLGADGHTASLVPGDAALDVNNVDVAVTGAYQGRRRMTLTFPALNRAQQRLWLVTGADKALALAGLRLGDPALPAARVRREHTLIVADCAAAGVHSPA